MTARPDRIRLSAPVATFTPPTDRIACIALAWWDADEPVGKRDPVIVAGPNGPRTYVAVFPTGPDGLLDGDRLRRGEVEIASWDIDGPDLAALRHRHAGWPLDRFDLLVHRTAAGLRLWPCRGATLRTTLAFLDLDRRLATAIQAAGLAA